DYSIDSILLIRNGYLVFERYFQEFTETTIHQLFSVTKSIMSCLTGVAVEENLLTLDQTLVSFFPDRVIDYLDSAKENITVEHLLTMSSGLDWVEAIQDPLCFGSEDPIQYVLDRPMDATPGEIFNYNSGAAHLLSAILTNVTEQTTLDYAQEKLLDHLGIENINWAKDSQGIYFGGHGISLNSRDMAKFGFLYLNNGTWETEQIISENWIINSRNRYNYTVEGNDYGYLWWLYPQYDSYTAQGFLGQIIHVFPKYDLIVVVTSSAFDTHFLIPTLISDFILPSLNEYPYTTTPTTTVTTDNTSLAIIPVAFAVALFWIKIAERRRKICCK
ncbi:MAG: serine hydrolase domain-containing protein, partial [Candidatus Heimdallarchaeota archaeon]